MTERMKPDTCQIFLELQPAMLGRDFNPENYLLLEPSQKTFRLTFCLR